MMISLSLAISAQIMRSVSKARYDSTIPIIGPAISFLRRIGWIVLVRPYLRVFANELVIPDRRGVHHFAADADHDPTAADRLILSCLQFAHDGLLTPNSSPVRNPPDPPF